MAVGKHVVRQLNGTDFTLTPLPLLAHIVRTFSDANVSIDIRPLIDAIEKDPAIAAKILSVSQSAMYGGKQVTSLKVAVARMGVPAVKKIALGIALGSIFNTKACGEFDSGRHWEKLIMGALCAQHICKAIPAFPIDDASMYCISLLQDLGLLLLVQQHPNEMSVVFSSDKSLLEAEIDVLGYTHYDMTESCLNYLAMPHQYVNAIKYCQNPDYRGEDWQLALVIYTANNFVKDPARSVNLIASSPFGFKQREYEQFVDYYLVDRTEAHGYAELIAMR